MIKLRNVSVDMTLTAGSRSKNVFFVARTRDAANNAGSDSFKSSSVWEELDLEKHS